VANTTQDMSLRDAQFKIKDLESSLKNEITLHQSIARRYEFHDFRCYQKLFELTVAGKATELPLTGVNEPMATGKL